MVASGQKSGFRGYCTHNEFGGKSIPVPLQNLTMRDYAAKNGLLFKLSVNEFYFPNSFLQFESLLRQLPLLEGVIMTSVTMLPQEAEERSRIYEQFFAHEASLHCVLENTVIAESGDVADIEDILQINLALANCPRTIAAELVGDPEVGNFFIPVIR